MPMQRAVPNTAIPTVKVYAAKDHVKRNGFANPPAYRLNKEGVGNWPFDQFTKRRLRDGDVTLEPPEEMQQQQLRSQQKKIEPPKKEGA